MSPNLRINWSRRHDCATLVLSGLSSVQGKVAVARFRRDHRRDRRRDELFLSAAQSCRLARKILLVVCRMLATGTAYEDLGPAYLDTVHRRRTAANRVRRLRDMGYQVTLRVTAA